MKRLNQNKLPQYLSASLAICFLLAMPVSVSAGGSTLDLEEDFAYTTSGQEILLNVLTNDRILLSSVNHTVAIINIGDPKVLGVSEQDYYRDNGTTRIDTSQAIGLDPALPVIIYQPTTSFTGVVEIPYTVINESDGTAASSIVRVAVSPPIPTSLPPTAGDDWAVTTTGKTIYINPFWNDTGSNLKITSVDPVGGNKGTMTIDEAVNQLVYTADVKESGEDTFYYNIEDDSGRAASATVKVNVGMVDASLPKAGNDRAASPGGKTIYINPLWNDTGSNLTIINVEGADGNLGTMTIDTAVNQLVFKSDSSDIREETFTYTVEDNQGRKSSATVKIDVTRGTRSALEQFQQD